MCQDGCRKKIDIQRKWRNWLLRYDNCDIIGTLGEICAVAYEENDWFVIKDE